MTRCATGEKQQRQQENRAQQQVFFFLQVLSVFLSDARLDWQSFVGASVPV